MASVMEKILMALEESEKNGVSEGGRRLLSRYAFCSMKVAAVAADDLNFATAFSKINAILDHRAESSAKEPTKERKKKRSLGAPQNPQSSTKKAKIEKVGSKQQQDRSCDGSGKWTRNSGSDSDSDSDSDSGSDSDSDSDTIDTNNIISTKRPRKTPQRYQDPALAEMYLKDVPAKELKAALVDEDFSSSSEEDDI